MTRKAKINSSRVSVRKKPALAKMRTAEIEKEWPGKIQEISYWGLLKEILKDPRAGGVLVFVGFIVGIATQINWIQLRCEDHPFFTTLPAHCQQNLLRVIIGAPVILIVMLLVSAVIRKLNKDVSLRQSVQLHLSLLPLGILPFVAKANLKNLIANATIFIFVLAALFLLRKHIWRLLRSFFAKPQFRVEIKFSEEDTVIVLSGLLTDGERDGIYESISDLNFQIPDFPNKVYIDVQNLKGYTKQFSYVFFILLGFGRLHRSDIYFRGDRALVDEISSSLAEKINRV